MTFHAMCARVMRGAACSPRKRSARRAARDASTRLVLPFVLLHMVASLVFPCGAFALSPNDQGVLWGPTSLGGGNSGIVVSATNNFDAALWAIGRWNTKIQLDNPKFAMLSNEGTGGHFYELASYFHSYAEVGTPNWPNAAAVEGYAISLGPDNVWLASVPLSLISDARRDYNTVLNGGSLGGGGAVTGDVLVFSGVPHYSVNSSNKYGIRVPSYSTTNDLYRYVGSSSDWESESFRFVGNPLTVSWPAAVLETSDFLTRFPLSEYDYWLAFTFNTSGVMTTWEVWAGKNPSITYGSNTVGAAGSQYVSNVTFSEYAKLSQSSLRDTSWPTAHYAYDGGTLTFSGLSSDSFGSISLTSSTTSGSLSASSIRQILHVGGFGGGGGGDNNWPTDDPTPTPDPPEVPGPSDDPVVEPDPPDLPNPVTYPVSDPYTPDPDPPANPVVTYDPNPTGEPTDYRPWLNAILVLLRKINTTLSDGFGDLRGWLTNHCDHIREQIHSDSVDLGLHVQTAIQNGFISFERWLQGTFSGYFLDEIDYLLGENFRELEGYLYDLFDWLASQFDFTFGGTSYDDSSVIYWLRRIYARLGGGAPNPGDDGTVDDGFDWWAWLLGLITDALGGVVTDLVGDIGGFLSEIAQKFPFSIPADIVLYLSLLDAPRETPVFTFVIPAIQGSWDSWEIEIDLSPYDDALSIVRSMVLIWWGFVLVLRTDWLGGVFDDGARMVTGFFDKLTGGVANA